MQEVESSPKLTLSKTLVKLVADRLGNTAAVCKAYYIHPAVQALTEEKDADLEKLLNKASTAYKDLKDKLSEAEMVALYLIEG
jgi:DNA topoisomerase IB